MYPNCYIRQIPHQFWLWILTNACLWSLPFSVLTREVTGVVGGRAKIPCDLTAPFPTDSPHLILFYKDVFGTPIYR